MRKEIDWSKYKFRASQVSKLMTGTIGITENNAAEIKELENERDTGINVNGNKCKWTPPKQERLAKLIAKRDAPKWEKIPATMRTELRKIYRAEMYNRNFVMTTKYIQKGIQQEEESITIYQNYRNHVVGERTFFVNNKERFTNDYLTGEPDLMPMLLSVGPDKGLRSGFDIKSSWELDTFPFPDDPLISAYEWQNRSYMELLDADLWITAACLPNATEHHLNNEKMKWFYSFKTKDGLPETPEHPMYDEYIETIKLVERNMIFDYDRFVAQNPYHDLEHSREEWFGNDYDIPLERRVVEKAVYRDKACIEDLYSRIELAREYLVYLEGQERPYENNAQAIRSRT